MRLSVLGCAGSVGGPGVPCSGYLLSTDGHQPILIDCGPGVFGELQRIIDPDEVDVMLSHLHADHCLDLPAMLVWRRYAPPPAVGRAHLYGPPGTALRIGAASSEIPGEVDDITDTFEVIEWRDDETRSIRGFEVTPRRVNHPPETYGLRIVGPAGQVLVYSGDTAVCEEVVDLARDAEVFLCEATWTHDPERPPNLHLSGYEAGEIATKAGVRSLLLTHVAPWTDAQAVLDEARSTYSGPVDLARPGQVFDLLP